MKYRVRCIGKNFYSIPSGGGYETKCQISFEDVFEHGIVSLTLDLYGNEADQYTLHEHYTVTLAKEGS